MKFWFCTDTPGSIGWLGPAHDCISVIVSRFEIVAGPCDLLFLVSRLAPQILVLFMSFSFLHWMNGAALRTNSIDSILENKELMKMQVDLQKTFPEIPCVSQMLGGPSLRLAIMKECLNIPSGIG